MNRRVTSEALSFKSHRALLASVGMTQGTIQCVMRLFAEVSLKARRSIFRLLAHNPELIADSSMPLCGRHRLGIKQQHEGESCPHQHSYSSLTSNSHHQLSHPTLKQNVVQDPHPPLWRDRYVLVEPNGEYLQLTSFLFVRLHRRLCPRTLACASQC